VTEEQARAMVHRDAYNLLFTPGLSLAKEITDLSGRGVGLDVVKSGFKRLGGSIEVNSRRGRGTEFTVKLPLTLAIVPALVVAVEDLCFAVPQVNIEEVVWLHGAEVHQELKLVDEQEVFWLRDRLLPILRLTRVLDIRRSYRDPETGETQADRRADAPDRRHAGESVAEERRDGPVERRGSDGNRTFILVMRVGEDRFGLLVDSIVDTEEIVVKSLHDQLKGCAAFAGTTVLGDGRIAMILDVAGVAELGHLRFVSREQEDVRARRSAGESRTLLLFDVGGSEVYGLPLSLVSRVEEVQPTRIQPANGRFYLEYRGAAMPILRIEDALGGSATGYGDDLVSVIIPRGDRPIGILAARILDTIEVQGEVDLTTLARPGFVGSTLVNGQLVLLLDLFDLITRVEPDWFGPGRGRTIGTGRVLLVEDSRFFAAILAPVLRSEGLDVLHAETGEEALKLLDEETFELAVCDVELGTMTGFDLARSVRSDPRTKDLPMVAISAARDSTIEVDALSAGFDRFESKLDQGRLLVALRSVVAARIPAGRC
jgi:two-component system chemotaxis sensor kinase CheA